MKIRNGLELQAKYYGKKAVVTIYKGSRLIWEAITSCFGAGFWRNNAAWKNTDCWKNN